MTDGLYTSSPGGQPLTSKRTSSPPAPLLFTEEENSFEALRQRLVYIVSHMQDRADDIAMAARDALNVIARVKYAKLLRGEETRVLQALVDRGWASWLDIGAMDHWQQRDLVQRYLWLLEVPV